MRPEPLDRAPAFRLHRVERLLRAHLLALLEPMNLTPEQFFVLMRLLDHDGTIQAGLGDPVLDDRATVSRQVARLEDRGLVERRVHPDDARARCVHLTDQGRDLLDGLSKLVNQERSRLFGTLDPADLAAFHRVLDDVEATLEGRA